MPAITERLPGLFAAVQRPGDFYSTGTADIFPPQLDVDGVGAIALPLLKFQIDQLVAAAERAPYGRGTETLVDTDVRRVWQINSKRIQIKGRHWPKDLQTIVRRASIGLGITEPVTAELYKLLVYDTGSFFVSHRDTEKAPGMFASLVIVLPSIYGGGELRVRHKDREVQLELGRTDPSEVAFAAFYADCVHEVLPITSGCRLTLIYNLLRKDSATQPEPPSYGVEQARIATELKRWVAAKTKPAGDDTTALPEKLIYPLEHAYTPAELAFDALKGADAALAPVLVTTARQADCDLYLALLSIEESGSAEYGGGYGGQRHIYRSFDDDEDEDNFDIGEVTDRSAKLSDWRAPDGAETQLGIFPFSDDELCPPDALADDEPDEQHFHEATGNAGASFERTYRRAALVLWPTSRRLAVLNQAGLAVTLPYLGDLTRRWRDSADDSSAALWQKAHQLVGFMLDSWPKGFNYAYKNNHRVEMLNLLRELEDRATVERFLSEITATGAYHKDDNTALVAALRLLPVAVAAGWVERIIVGNALDALGACAELLARAIAMVASLAITDEVGSIAAFLPAAKALLDALPDGTLKNTPNPLWRRSEAVDVASVVDLLTAFARLDAVLATTLTETASKKMLCHPKIYLTDEILVPAALDLMGHRGGRLIHQASVAHLKARIALALEAPADWTRSSGMPCRCRDCTALNQFLTAPDRQKWIFKAAQAARSHVESSILLIRADVDLATDTRGRPYGLVCTKNQASFDRRVQQRAKDIADLARLEPASSCVAQAP